MRGALVAAVQLLAVALAAASPGAVSAATPVAGGTPPASDHLAAYAGLLGDGVLQQPSDLAVGPDGTVWVTDMGTDQIHRFGDDGRHLGAFGETGQGPGQFEFADFGAVGLDGEGNVYVLDTGNQRVQVFTPDLAFVRAWGESGAGDGVFLHPSDIAVRDDAAVFVVDAQSGRVKQFGADGTVVREIVPSGLATRFFEPARLGLDAAGNLYVPDITRIYVFDREGLQIRAIQTTEIDNGEVGLGMGAAVSRSGFLYVSDWQAGRIAVFDPMGAAIGSFGNRGAEPGQFDEPDTLVFDGRGRLLVLDFANRRIQAFVPVEPSGGTPAAG